MPRDSDYFPKIHHGVTSFADAPGSVEIFDTDVSVNGVPLSEDATSTFTNTIVLSRFDDFYFSVNADEVSGGRGNDHITLDFGDGIAHGNAGDDSLSGGQNGLAFAYGDQGNDNLHADHMIGGPGADDFHLDYWFNDIAAFSNAGAEVLDFNPAKGDHLIFSGDGNTDPVITHVGDLWTVTSVDQAYRDFIGDPNALFSTTFHLDGVTHLDPSDFTFDVPVTVEGDVLV